MFAVIFEVNPHPAQWDAYLGHAKALRPDLERTDGFIENERFSSLHRPGWVLSLSLWRDEAALIRWRGFAAHRAAQANGRSQVFRDYRLRVGEIIADRSGETEMTARLVGLSEAALAGLPATPEAAAVAARFGARNLAAQPNLGDWDAFENINRPGHFILLTGWREVGAPAPPFSGGISRRCVRVIRDYGMFDRAEAPQHFPNVPNRPSRASNSRWRLCRSGKSGHSRQ